MKSAFSFLLVCLPVFALAQELKSVGVSADDVVPAGWEIVQECGDLNKDGMEDLVVIATPNIAENMLTRDDGYVYNFNQPVLAIYFGASDGNFKLWKQYDNVLDHQIDEFLFINSSLKITAKGTLQIYMEYFASAGSANTSKKTYTFRFQEGDFFLIGKDEEDMSRYSGEYTEVSSNYLTYRRKTTTTNVFKKDARERVVWSRLPKARLQCLGEFKIE